MSAGESFGSYELIEKLGAGGMGAVFKARHKTLGRVAAIKFLLPELSTRPEIIERFHNEARAASHVQHPGVAHIYEFGVDPERGAFIVMELLRGESLQDRLDERGRLSVEQSVRVARHVCSALKAAHAKGVVHRDLKPDNIFMTPDPDIEGGERPKLLDFGIAKLTDPELLDGENHWKTTAPMGTPYYMSPEQCRADPALDGRADLYALGCIMYQCISGRLPIEGQNYLELIEAHKSHTPPPVTTFVPSCSTELADLIGRLMAKRPEERPASAQAVYEELGAVLAKSVDGRALAATDPNGGTAPPPATELPVVTEQPRARASAAIDTVKSPSSRLVPLVAIALVACAAVAIFLITRGGSSAELPDAAVDAVVAVDAKPDKPVEPGWIRIPAARFMMGSTADEISDAIALCKSEAPPGLCTAALYERESPAREVAVSSFEIQKREVDNSELAAWLSRAGATASGDEVELGGSVVAGLGDRSGIARRQDRFVALEQRGEVAAAMVSWHGARRYCQSIGGDLPSEAQWEFAARGVDRRTYPSGGDRPSCTAVVYGRAEKGPCPDYPARAESASDLAGDQTPEGVSGLTGNVSEWVLDSFAPYGACDGCSDPVVLEASPDLAVIRGGAFNDFTEGIRSAGRKKAGPSELLGNVGFRCVRAR